MLPKKVVVNLNCKFKRQLIIISVSKFKTQNLNQELKESKSHSIRPTLAITENYNDAKIDNLLRTVPGDRSCSSTMKNEKKIFIVCDNHIRQIKRNLFSKSFYKRTAHLNGFHCTKNLIFFFQMF